MLSEVARKASVAQEENRNLDGTVIASTPSKLTEDEANAITSKALTVALCKDWHLVSGHVASSSKYG